MVEILPHLDLIGLVVQNMRASLDFYRLLGLQFAQGADDEGHVEVRVGGLRLAWDTVEVIHSFDPSWQAPQGCARVALAFELPSPAAVDDLFHLLMAKGYSGHVEPFDAPWGMRYAVVYDPDNNAVDLFAGNT